MPTTTPWKVTHYDHSSVALGEVAPEGLHFDLYLNKVGDIQYDIDLSSPLATIGNTRPYYTDYVLSRGNTNIQGGIHTGINIEDVGAGDVLQVAGLDWLHYFEGCQWPFDPTNPTANIYLQVNRDLALIVKDLLDTILAQTNRLSFAYVLAAIGQTMNYRIDVADTTNLYDRINTLSQISPGFDFAVSPDLARTFAIYAPQRGIVNNNIVFEQGTNIYIGSYGNTGPKGTHVLALATSTSGGQLGLQIDNAVQPYTRRWDVEEQFDNVTDLTQLSKIASGTGDRDGADQIAFTCKYVPREGEDFWNTVSMGDSLRCIVQIADYTKLDQYFRLVGISCDVTDEGEEEIDLTFDYTTLSL